MAVDTHSSHTAAFFSFQEKMMTPNKQGNSADFLASSVAFGHQSTEKEKLYPQMSRTEPSVAIFQCVS